MQTKLDKPRLEEISFKTPQPILPTQEATPGSTPTLRNMPDGEPVSELRQYLKIVRIYEEASEGMPWNHHRTVQKWEFRWKRLWDLPG
jgi:hypothetical protein